MQPFLLRVSLREMCESGKWSYAVFWTVCRGNPRLLTWEQYHNASSGLSHVPPNLCDMMFTPESEELKQQWLSPEGVFFSTSRNEDVIINKMMINDHIVMVGQGLVGRSAFVGHHQWFVSENYVRDDHPPEVSNDLDYQFSKGIKTVAVIPVLPYGVIRLGSTSIVGEDIETVKSVKALIHQLGCTPVDQNLIHIHNNASLIQKWNNSINSSELGKSHSTSPGSTTPWGRPLIDPLNNFYNKSIVESSNRLFSTNSRVGVSNSQEVYMKPDALLDDQASNFLQYGQQETGVAQKNRFDRNQFASKPTKEFEKPAPEIRSVPIFQDSVSHVHTGNDLQTIFSGFIKRKRPTSENEATSTIVNGNSDDHAASIVYDDNDTDSGLFSSTTCTDHLLDAVVSGLMAKKESSPIIRNACVYSSQNTCSATTANSMENGSFLFGKTTDNLGLVVSASLTSGFGEDSRGNITGEKSQITSWIEQSTGLNRESCASTTYHKKNDRTCRKRPKTRENLKPRPKDRQLIQDRIKELRLIVPFGEKCSIDALLERTIKHMVFLQNVMCYGDALRRFHFLKTCKKDGEHYTGIDFNVEAAVLMEFASRAVLGLIIVEDFEAPHLMMVEMICEGTGFLFEISGMIRGLGLKILHGLMEIRGDKTYARFMIETEKDVTRIEVFMSLVSLLFPTMKISDSLFEPHGEFASLMLVV